MPIAARKEDKNSYNNNETKYFYAKDLSEV